MGISHTTVAVTGGATWASATINNPKSVRVEVVDTVSDVQVDVSFDNGTTVHDILGPFSSREMAKTYQNPSSYRIYFRCSSDATVEVTSEK